MQKSLSKVILVLLAISAAFLFYRKVNVEPKGINHEAEKTEQHLPDDFHNFYNQFHADSAYQMEHIIWPVQGIGKSFVDSVQVVEEREWMPEDWIIHKPFNAGGVFERSFINTSGLVTEFISGQGGLFTLEKRYAKIQEEWFLIYYQELIMAEIEE